MKFSLRYMLLEVALISIFLAIGFGYKPMWMGRESFTLHAIEVVVMTTLLIVSFCAAIGGLFLRPGRGAIVGLVLALILVPIALLGSIY